MKRKLVKNGRGVIINIPPAFLELLDIKSGQDVDIQYNPKSGKIEISKTQEGTIIV